MLESFHWARYCQSPPIQSPHYLPSEITVKLTGLSPNECFLLPTHVLAVYSSDFERPLDLRLFLTDQILLTAFCKYSPSFPSGTQPDFDPDLPTATLPVVTLGLPYPETFYILHAYFCHQNEDDLFSYLVDYSPNVFANMQYADLILSVERNARHLGVVDEKLYPLLFRIWTRMRALSLSQVALLEAEDQDFVDYTAGLEPVGG